MSEKNVCNLVVDRPIGHFAVSVVSNTRLLWGMQTTQSKHRNCGISNRENVWTSCTLHMENMPTLT